MSRRISRRDFLRTASLAAGGAALGAALPRLGRLPAARAGEEAAGAASLLVRAPCPGAAAMDGAALAGKLNVLTDKALVALAEAAGNAPGATPAPGDPAAAAWAALAGPEDRVAILVNGCHNTREGPTRLSLVNHVILRLTEAGVPANAITICERDNQQLEYGSYDRDHIDNAEVNLFAHNFEDRHFGPTVSVGQVRTKIARPVTDATLLVRMPLMRTHMNFGLTGAMKLLFGHFKDPRALHGQQRLITELNKLPDFHRKKNLIIADGVESPGYPRHGGDALLVSQEPATVDYQLYQHLLARGANWQIKRRRGKGRGADEPLELWLRRALDDGALGSDSPRIIEVTAD